MYAIKNMLTSFLVGALLALQAIAAPSASQPEWGNFFSGNTLMEHCKDTKKGEPSANVNRYQACAGYLMGVFDGQNAYVAWTNKRGHICAPPTVTSEQLRQVFLKDVASQPENWGWEASMLAVLAFQRAWPCPE